MNFFKKFYLPPNRTSENGDGELVNEDESTDTNRDNNIPFKRTYLKSDLFTDSSAANEYVCKICHFMAVDPLEHVPGPDVTCSNIFCLPCVKTYSASGLSSCPAEGCLTTGFNLKSLRELGTREIARLLNLTLQCEFNCSQIISYRDYWSHREKCPSNPENFCEICDSPKTCDTHSCREVFIRLKKRDESLVNENKNLKTEIDKLRRELDSLRGAHRINGSTPLNTTCTNNDDTHTNGTNNPSSTTNPSASVNLTSTSEDNKNGIKFKQRGKLGPNKGNYKNGKSDTNNNNNSQTMMNPHYNHHRDNSMDSRGASSNYPKNDGDDCENTGFLRGSVPQYKFHSNCFEMKHDSNKIRLIFHFGEKNYKIDDVLPTYTFRTLRSCLRDNMNHDPGIMLLIRHRILEDKETVASCGFKPGFNSISLVPFDISAFNKDCLGLYRLKNASDPLDAKKVPKETIKQIDLPFISQEAINFYSNSFDPQSTDKDITLTFHHNGKDISLERVKRDQTIGSIRSMADYMIEGGVGKMMYITHQVIKDDMTVKQCGIGCGTYDITLLPISFPFDIDKTRTMHLMRFKPNGKFSKKLGKMKSRTNSMASLF